MATTPSISVSHGLPGMNKISSSTLFFSKRLFPVIWFGFLAFFVFMAFLSGATKQTASILIMPLVMTPLGFFVMKKLVWDLADEVYDCGDSLLVKNGGEEEQVPLSNIMNVSVSTMVNPPRITLRLINPGKFGDEIAFSPAMGFRLNPFNRCKIADDLILRVHNARSR